MKQLLVLEGLAAGIDQLLRKGAAIHVGLVKNSDGKIVIRVKATTWEGRCRVCLPSKIEEEMNNHSGKV